MKEGVTIILTVVLLLPPPCRGDAVCFVVKAKVLCLGFQMSTQLKISGSIKLYLQHCSRTERKYLSVCSAFYRGLNLGESSLHCEQYEWL